jgi:hypothetical protein
MAKERRDDHHPGRNLLTTANRRCRNGVAEGVNPMIKQTEELAETQQTEDPGFVLVVYWEPFRRREVRGRFTRAIADEAKRRLEQCDDVLLVVVEAADRFQARMDQTRHYPTDSCGRPVNVMHRPLIKSLPEVKTER